MSARRGVSLVILYLLFMSISPVSCAASSSQTTMQSIADLYNSHDVVLDVRLVGSTLLSKNSICYTARVINGYKGWRHDVIAFTAFQRASVGEEYLLVGDAENIGQPGCKGAVNLHSSSGDIFYPILVSPIKQNAKKWIAMKGVLLKKSTIYSVYDGNHLCQIDLEGSSFGVCNVFGSIVRWDDTSRELMNLKKGDSGIGK